MREEKGKTKKRGNGKGGGKKRRKEERNGGKGMKERKKKNRKQRKIEGMCYRESEIEKDWEGRERQREGDKTNKKER